MGIYILISYVILQSINNQFHIIKKEQKHIFIESYKCRPNLFYMGKLYDSNYCNFIIF